MKILLLNSLYPPSEVGGAEYSVQILAEQLNGSGFEVVVISLAKSSSKESINGITVYRIELKNIYWPYDQKDKKTYLSPLWHLLDVHNPWMKDNVSGIIQKERPHLIHTHNLQGFSTNVWRVANQLNIPIVHTLRDYWLRCPRTTMYKNNRICERPCLDCKMLSITKKKDSARVQGVVGISKFILDNHLGDGYFKNARVKTVIYNSINQELVSPVSNNGKFQAGFLGRISEAKGVKMLIDAFKDSEIPLLIGGKGNEHILDYLSGLNAPNIQYVGYVDPKDFFSKIDILIVPSLWHEPFGRVVIEAYANGVPVIVNNTGGLPDIVDSEQTGFIIDMGKEDLAEKVLKLKSNPQMLDRMKEAAHKKAAEFVSGKANCENYIRLYKQLIQENA